MVWAGYGQGLVPCMCTLHMHSKINDFLIQTYAITAEIQKCIESNHGNIGVYWWLQAL